MTTLHSAALAALLCLAAGPGFAATCHLTVQGVPVIDDRTCTSAGRGRDIRVAVEGEDLIRIRRSVMSGRFVVRGSRDGRLRRIGVSYGQVVTSTDSDDKTCYFNQKATLCIDP